MALKCVNKQGIKNWMLGFVLLLGTSVFSQPTITNFSPNSGPIGTLVTITGTNLSNPTGITIAGVSAIPISNNGNTLVAMVMPGATTGGVSVTTSGGTANGSGNFLVTSSQVPNTQQGNKLVGTGAVWQGSQGSSVSISADGNTAIVGGDGDNGVGAAWIYTLSGGVWTQQGNKLVGTGSVGPGYQGFSVSISADGNTAIVGSFRDNNFVGAAWVYTRSGGVWTQQGNKLVGTGAVGSAYQGWSVSISADGNTAIVGGYNDNSNVGAAWVYTRSGGVWTQQGNKLVGTGSVGQGRQGSSVSISADGNTAIVGGDGDNGVGAVWVYTRSGGVWTQQGNKLVGTGAVGSARQGFSVSISADGNTAIAGGYNDNSSVGAAWVFTRSGSVWTQQGNKLVGTGAVGSARQGISVSISADGNTAIVGGDYDNSNVGAAWVYTRSGGVWWQQGNKLIGTGAVGEGEQGRSVSISADGNTAIVGGYRDNNYVGAAWVYTYLPPAPTITSFTPTSAAAGAIISITGTNFNNTSAITLGGTPVTSFTVVSSTSIVATVGAGATGAVSLTTPGGSASLAGFTFIPAPTITSFSSTSGPIGSLVTINGTNLSNPTGITIGGASAIPISNDGTTLVAMVMPGATTGGVSVTTLGGTANGSGSFIVIASQVPNTQQGNKLVGTGTVGSSNQGLSVSISADGNTAIVGGNSDNSNAGAAWIYTRIGGVWTQQGNKLVGTGAIGQGFQGFSVSISADGNTAIVGGINDNSGVGAAWVYIRSGGVWTQQGNKLVGTGAVGPALQGISVSISADGNTAIVGGYGDNTNRGAAWIYTRSGGVWTQQGNKLVGTGAVGAWALQGINVSISADGNTAIVGGYYDNSNVGAAWVYTRSGGVWTQQGNKLVGTGAEGKGQQGISVSLSADGNTAIVGSNEDNGGVGAAWVYTRSGGVWTQQGNKLVGTGGVGASEQGQSVSISADGNTAIVGGFSDNSGIGATWVYTRSGGVWTQQGNKLVGTGAVGQGEQGRSVSISADGNTAIVGGYRDDNYTGAAWVYTYLPPSPTITNFTPTSAAAGAIISITGTNFNNTSAITLGGTPVTSFTVVSNTSIIAVVGSGSSGAVSLTTPSGTASLNGFTFIPPPTITSFSPMIAGAGALIGITGTNFDNTSVITLGGTQVTSFTVVSSTSIIALVGAGSTGAVSLTTPGGTASLAGFIFSSPPSISSFTATTGPVGTLVTINGNHLSYPLNIMIAGVPAIPIRNDGNTLVAMVMPGATVGGVSVTTPGGTANGSGN
ncbi:MAG: IPT/TIG domain-containing protein, partial [Chitinophagaceae bacterium]|nr:IPT/TIG domain-containing protein [Chitinophagaceae bacterium]